GAHGNGRDAPETAARASPCERVKPSRTGSSTPAPVCFSNRSLVRGSLDYLVGAREDRRRDRQAERIGGFEIDDELVSGSLLDSQVGRFRALEDLVDVDRGAARQILVIWPVAHQAGLLHVGPDPEYGWQPVRQC